MISIVTVDPSTQPAQSGDCTQVRFAGSSGQVTSTCVFGKLPSSSGFPHPSTFVTLPVIFISHLERVWRMPQDPSQELVLSLFPGLGLLDRAFREVGYSVVRGPDLIWGESIEGWHSPPGRFTGVIGGPPCVHYSDASRSRNPAEGDRLVCEFLRCIDESQPEWWLMENVRNVPTVKISPYIVQRLDLTALECGGKTRRLRHFQFGSFDGSLLRAARPFPARSVTAPAACMASADPRSERLYRTAAKMGFPGISLPGFRPAAKRRLLGNGVPWEMGITVARGVAAASPRTAADCHCGCGREIVPPARYAGDACRQRASRRARGKVRQLEYPPTAGTVTRALSYSPRGVTEHVESFTWM